MKRKNNRSFVWMAALALPLFAACSSEMDNPTDSQEVAKGYTYQVQVDSKGEGFIKAGKGTRALDLTDNDTKLLSTWDKSKDKLMLYSLSDNELSTQKDYSLIEPDKNGTVASFFGSINTANQLKTTDDIVFFYPGTVTNDRTRTMPVEMSTSSKVYGGVPGAPYHPVSASQRIRKNILVDLSNQDGTIQGIGDKYDVQWAKMNPKSISGNSIYFKAIELKRKISIWGLKLTDARGNAINNVDSVLVGGITSADLFDLSTGQFGGATTAEKQEIYTIAKKSETTGQTTPISSTSNYLWLAIIPGRYSSGITITVFCQDGKKYTRLFPSAAFGEGKLHKSTIKMYEGNFPYIEVEGVKWAPGNFIRYANSSFADANYPSGVYTGIAPTQWWYAKYKEVEYGKRIGTQMWTRDCAFDPNDNDLFRWGDIENITTTDWSSPFCRKSHADFGTYNFSGTTGVENSLCRTLWDSYESSAYPANRSNAVAGDVVWYYTMNNKRKYRYPAWNEYDKLYSDANMYLAYCYTGAGNKSYGVYFTTHNGNRQTYRSLRGGTYFNDFIRIGFSTTGASLNYINTGNIDDSRYIDVTKQVAAGKGLFLPFTGIRVGYAHNVTLKQMWNGSCYGRYNNGAATGATGFGRLSGCLFIGAQTNLDKGSNLKDDGCAIRPVFDESNSDNPEADPQYKGFLDLR